MNIREALEKIKMESMNEHNNTADKVVADQQSNNNGIVRKRTYSNLSSYEVGFLQAFEYLLKKSSTDKDVSAIDIRAVALARYSELIKVLHGVNKDEYYMAWVDAKQAVLSKEQIYVSD